MPTAYPDHRPTLFGRSSSHFTRITRIFAAELGVDYAFHIVRDIMSDNPNDYGDNPALKLPVLKTAQDTWFGALNICRELSRLAPRPLQIVWPEDRHQALLTNAQEFVTSALSTGVILVMSKLSGVAEDNTHQAKARKSLLNMMAWLEKHANEALASLPTTRELSYLETSLYCLVTHLEFRDIVPVSPYPKLRNFCAHFGERASVKQTTFRFDN